METIRVLLFVILSIGSIDFSFAGPLCSLGPHNHKPSNDQNATQVAHETMGHVHQYLCGNFGCPQYRLFQNTTISNAMASRDHTGNTIRYNPYFMNQTVQNYGSLAATGILAHELGHIIDFYKNPNNIPSAQREATADRYAGCAFALEGHPESDLMGLAHSLQAMGISPGYPTPSQRVQLLRSGYNECK